MSLRTRPVRRDDIPAIVAFTRNTFVWGDYVPDVIADWIEEDDAVTYVAVDPDDVPVGVARGQLLSPAEVWYGAARVRSDRRGEGIAGDLARALLDWSRRRGARVGRLLVEDWNEASHRQVAKSGMRPVAHVDRCTRTVGDASPTPISHTGRGAGRGRGHLGGGGDTGARLRRSSSHPLGVRRCGPRPWSRWSGRR